MDRDSADEAAGRLGSGGPQRLMVVDAAEDSGRDTADFFRAHGWEVTVARGAVEALVHTLTRGVDVVIMSARLPDLEGYEVAAILKRVSPGVEIILTADPEGQADSGESRRADCFRCFPKPLDLEELARVVEGARP